MDAQVKKAPIEVIYHFAKAGLIHARRWCSFCNSRMRLVRTRRDYIGYIWICPICFDAKRVTQSTPLNTLNPLLFDFSLAMWIRGATPKMAGDMSCGGNSLQQQFALFRKASHHYMHTKVLPYLQLHGPIEIDEAKIGRRRWHFRGEFPKKIRWAFGMYCRTTGIPILYEIKSKVHGYLVGLMKKHMPSGRVVLSDHHSSYVILRSGKSHLARHGWYHFWVNHSSFYIHEKFNFVFTGNIERVWAQLRHQCMPLKFQRSSERIDEYLQTYTLTQLLKPKKRYTFTLKVLRDYYFYNHWLYRKNRLMEEERVPSLARIEEVNQKLCKEGIFFRDYDREYTRKNLDKLQLFLNQDLEDCHVVQTELDMDCSLLNLRNDPNKHMVGSATKMSFGKLDGGWTSTPATGENFMIPRRRFSRRVMLLSLDPLEDLELKRAEIKDRLSAEQMQNLLDENSALNRLSKRNLNLLAYEPESHLSQNQQQVASEDDMVENCGRLKWPANEISSLEKQKGAASRTHVRTVIERGLGQRISLTGEAPTI